MTNSQKMYEVSEVQLLIKEAGLEDIVDIKVEVMEDQYGKKVPHIVADIPNCSYKRVNDEVVYCDDTFERAEPLNKYFSGKIFAMGITQRKDYLLASFDVKVECHKQNIHPAQYKAPTDEVDVMQDIPNPIEVTRKEGKKTNKYPNGYQGKIDFYLDMAAKAIGTTRYTYYDGKVKYFLGRQDEWLKTNSEVNI